MCVCLCVQSIAFFYTTLIAWRYRYMHCLELYGFKMVFVSFFVSGYISIYVYDYMCSIGKGGNSH